MKKFTVIVGSLTLVAILAAGAWAGNWGPGPGYGQGNCPGYAAGGPGYGPGRGFGPGPQMTKEDFAKFQAKRAEFQAKRAAFLKDTAQLRQTKAIKRIELRTEIAQVKPDQAKIQALRNELIDLRAQLAKKANAAGLPAYGLARGKGSGFGPGRGHGPRGGYGSGGGYGKGACWR